MLQETAMVEKGDVEASRNHVIHNRDFFGSLVFLGKVENSEIFCVQSFYLALVLRWSDIKRKEWYVILLKT